MYTQGGPRFCMMILGRDFPTMFEPNSEPQKSSASAQFMPWASSMHGGRKRMRVCLAWGATMSVRHDAESIERTCCPRQQVARGMGPSRSATREVAACDVC